jgi:hypothetical protein
MIMWSEEKIARRGTRPYVLGKGPGCLFLFFGIIDCIARRLVEIPRAHRAHFIVLNTSDIMPNISVHATCNAMIHSPSLLFSLLLHNDCRTQRLERLNNLLRLLLWHALFHHLRRALNKLLALTSLMTFGFAPASNFSSLRLNNVFSAAAGAASSSSTGAAAGAAPPAAPPLTKPPIGMSGMFRRSYWVSG